MVLISLIPLIGWIWLIILLAQKGEPKENKYGAILQPIAVNEEKIEVQE